MNLGFPTRFLKKLDIYQQIRSGQGISKHKDLWKHEAAFLKTAYGKDHQHLNTRVKFEDFKKWIEREESDCDNGSYGAVLGNLFYRGYVDVIRMNNVECKCILKREEQAFDNDYLADGKNEIRPTMNGLLVGEILSEIKNKNCFLRYWNEYRYSFVIDMFWLLIFLSLMNVFFGEKLSEISENIKEISIKFCCFDFGHNILIAFLVFILWPFLNLLYRRFYLFIESWE